MSSVISFLEKRLGEKSFRFTKKPILIGGMAMEYYGLRKSGADIDLVITDEDYQTLSSSYPDKRKDLWGDLGVVIDMFEIWRSIALLDYDFYSKDAIDEGMVVVVSLDRLLFMRVIAMEVDKYRSDLQLLKGFYYETFRNKEFLHNMEKHMSLYEKNSGVVFGGNYLDEVE